MFVTIVTAFELGSNQSRRVPDATDQRGRPAHVVLGGLKPDMVKLLQRRANWVSYTVAVLLNVRLSSASDRIAAHSQIRVCANCRHLANLP